MFAKRLRWFALAMVALALIIIGRLVDIQIARAGFYEALADEMLTRPVTYLDAPRGSILDRRGRVLVADQPASDIRIRYEVLLSLLSKELPRETRSYLRARARQLRDRGFFPVDMSTDAIEAQFLEKLGDLWPLLSERLMIPRGDLIERARRIQWRVEQIKRVVQERSPTITEVAEEHAYHALVPAVEEDVALAVRIELEAQHPWLSVVPSSRRVAFDADSLVHLLGRCGSATAERIEADALGGDELRGLRSGDRCGVAGVERLAELTLRGTHGRIIEDIDRTELERVNPQQGSDVYLTIDANLQQQIYDLLDKHVRETLKDSAQDPAGGAAAVVLDVETREVLALVSYPGYSYEEYARSYGELAADNRWQPLRFRAVANMYPPGSTCKVIALYGGLAEHVVSTQERITCNGFFRPDNPNRFRCWYYNQYGLTHGPQTAEDAIRNSCNIFFYTMGDRLGVDRMCKWFSRFGLGKLQGTGLIEETPGIVPTSEWIARNRHNDPRVWPADAWNFAIGQGEVSATPLQTANVAATIASGRWEPVHLARDADGNWLGAADTDPPIDFDEQLLRVMRRGMWRVVNEPGGTAYSGAHFDDPFYEMCGKTGSAQASRRVISKEYTLEWPDGSRETVVASSKHEALGRYDGEKPIIIDDRIHELFPPGAGPDSKLPSHAWFMAYTQPRSTPRGERPRGKSYAISVIIEYGGSGGRVAGPVAREIAKLLLDSARG